MMCRRGAAHAFIVTFIGALLLSAALSPVSGGRVSAQASSAVGNLDTEEDDSSRLHWRGTSLALSQSLNVNAFAKSAQTSYNPEYSWTFILLPRWYLSKTTFLNIDQRLYLELTDSDSTLYGRRAMLSDTIVGVDSALFDQELKGDANLLFSAGGHLIAPTSLGSRADTMVVGGRARASGTLVWKNVLKGATLHLQGRYTHRFLRHNTKQVEEAFPCLAGGTSSDSCEFLGSATGVTDALSTIISGSLQLNEQLSVELLVWLSWSRGAGLAPYTRTIETGTVELPDSSTTHWRNERYLVLGANWEATEWLSVGLSLINYFPEKGPDGANRGLGNPLDLLIGLTTSVAFDHLYMAVTGRGKPSTATAMLRR